MISVDAKRFDRVFRKLRDMPKLWDQDELKVPPQHQFLRELHVLIGAMSIEELDQFIDQMGFEPVKGWSNKTQTAWEIVDEVFDIFDDGLELHGDPEVIQYMTD